MPRKPFGAGCGAEMEPLFAALLRRCSGGGGNREELG